MSTDTPRNRRHFLHRASRATALAAASLPLWSTPARAVLRGERRLALVHTHTGERLELTYAVDEDRSLAAMSALDHFLRDHYSGAVGHVDPQLFELLHRVQQVLGRNSTFEVISGYRSPATNARLREAGGGGVARHSLHMEGRALDVRLTGVVLADLRDAALSLHAGGVGFYAREQFVHLDTGRVRAW